MLNNAQAKQNTKPEGVLPQDPTSALKSLIALTEQMASFTEDATRKLVQNDMLGIAIMQHDKEVLAEKYQLAAREFSRRVEEFRSCDKALIQKLEAAQNELNTQAKQNNQFLSKIINRSREKTQSTLFTAQDLAQKVPVKFEREVHTKNAQEQNENKGE